MSADILILPVIRIERDQQGKHVIVPLSELTLSCLAARAKQWNPSVEETASLMLGDDLDPRRKR